MIIPTTDKLWVKCKFDENFNEVSYVDNFGISYEFIDPIAGTLKFYKNKNIDISQELLDNINNIKSSDKKEQLFLKLFSNIVLVKKYSKYPDSLFFKNKINHKIYFVYGFPTNIFWINNIEVWSKFELKKSTYYDIEYDRVKEFMLINLTKYLKLINIKPNRAFTLDIFKI